MTITSMEQLERELLREMRRAMEVASQKMLGDMSEEVADFYTGGEPTMYERTGALGDTARTSPIEQNGNVIEFEAYLDTNYNYTTGKNPTMLDVLNLANDGITNSSVGKLRKTVGKQGFWERAEEKMEKSFNNTMRSYFNG